MKKPISFKTFKAVNISIVLIIFFAALTFASINYPTSDDFTEFMAILLTTFILMFLCYLPFLLYQKSRVAGFESVGFPKIIFAIHPSQKTNTQAGPKPLTALKTSFSSFFHEEKRSNVATLGSRIIAYLIDVSILLAVVLISAVLIILTALLFETKDNTAIIIGLVVFYTLPCLAALIYLFTRDGFNGQSIGKKKMKIQVVYLDTMQPINFKTSAWRYLALRILGLVEFLVMLFQPNRRRIGDLLNKTIVINKNL